MSTITLYELRVMHSGSEKVINVYSDLNPLEHDFLHICQEYNYFSNQAFIYTIDYDTDTEEVNLAYYKSINYVMSYHGTAKLRLHITGVKNTGQQDDLTISLCSAADAEDVLDVYEEEREAMSDRIYDLMGRNWLTIHSYSFYVTLSAENHAESYQPTILIDDPRREAIWV